MQLVKCRVDRLGYLCVHLRLLLGHGILHGESKSKVGASREKIKGKLGTKVQVKARVS